MKRSIPFSAAAFLLLLSMTLDCSAVIGPLTKEQLILESQDVIHGIVKEVKSEWDENHSIIYTYVKIEVIHIYKGEPRDEVIVQIPGGTVGDVILDVEDTPELKEGMEIIIHTFLKENGNLWINGWDKGVYAVKNGVIEQLNMTLEQFKNLVDELIKK
jgi:hypothetical protein